MKILSEPIIFDWDLGNFFKNLKKNKVTVQESEEVFGNEPFIEEDTKHSTVYEQRFQGLGKTKLARKLFSFNKRLGRKKY